MRFKRFLEITYPFWILAAMVLFFVIGSYTCDGGGNGRARVIKFKP